MSRVYDTIVIGAGWSGAVAARDIAKSGHSVLVIEARDRIGGRASTYTKGMHVPIDLGCSFIHGYKEGNPARDIAKELNVTANVAQPTDSQVWRSNKPEPPSVVSKLQRNIAAARAFARAVFPPPSTTAPLSDALFGLQSPLFADVSDRDMVIALARTMEVGLGATIERTSLRWDGWEDNFAGSDAAPEGGFQSLVEKVLGDGQSEIKTAEAVQKIENGENGIKVTTDKGVEYTAKTAICTIPLGVLKLTARTLFEPPLPPHRLETIEDTHVGILEKLVLAYPSAWWPDASTIGSFILLPSESGDDQPQDPKTVFRRNTFILSSFAAPALKRQHPTLLFYISPTPALALDHFSPQEVIKAAHEFLIERFGVSPAPEPTAGTLTNWHKDPLARGATTTPSVIGEGRGPLDFVELGKPLWGGSLCFAGEHTDPNHRGSVAGAVISGMREAERVKKLLRKLSEA